MIEKKSYSYDRFFVSNQSFTTEHVKIVENYMFFFSKFLEFQVKWQACYMFKGLFLVKN